MFMRKTLFRQGALEFRRGKLIGDALLAGPFSLRVLTAATCGLAASVIAFACWGQYTPKVHVSGYVAPSTGLIRVYATQTGTLVEQRVSEGQYVHHGDTLFVLSTEEGSLQAPLIESAAIETIEQRLASLERELATERLLSDEQVRRTCARIRDTEAELAVVRAGITTQEQRIASAERGVSRYENNLPQGYVPQVQVQQKRDESLEQQARLEELERSRVSLQRDIDSLSRELVAGELKNTSQREAAARERAALQQQLTEYQARHTVLITAPGDGTVTAILATRGQKTSPQRLLLSILPAGSRLDALLLVPGRAIGLIEVGERVALHLQLLPYQHVGGPMGRVTEISRALMTPSDGLSTATTPEAAYRVVVALDSEVMHTRNHDFTLQPGMPLDADITTSWFSLGYAPASP